MPNPSNLKATALFEQAASIEYANFDPFAHKLVGERVFKK
jgi:glutathione S-transferase